ncbi:MAG: glycosyltransferase [Bacteroidetes bacterium]|nr:glycosyltransferase [Bacteroidota bacterium]
MVKISVVIITFNEEENIARCIDSVRPIADEIVVIDSFSKDLTKKICLEKGVRFIEHPFEGHIQQKNFGLTQAQYDHVLSLDADEYLSPELTYSIFFAKKLWPAEAYEMNRLSSYGGRWMKLSAWYPDRKLRLWNRKLGTWGGDNPHDKVILTKKVNVMHLKGDLMHEAYDNASEFLVKVQGYSDIFAKEKRYVLHSSSFKIFYKTFYSFFFNFFVKLGLFGGYEGAMISMSNTNYTFYKYSKLYEANRQLKISLIILAKCKRDSLELVLLSIMRQSVLPDEVIITLARPSEETLQLIASFQSIFPVALHAKYTQTAEQPVAQAIEQAKNEYLIFVDGDVVLHKNFIKSHKCNAWKGRFLQGSSVHLYPRKTESLIKEKKTKVSFNDSGIGNRLRAIESNILSLLFSSYKKGFKKGRPLNLSCWKEDIDAVLVPGRDQVDIADLFVKLEALDIRRKNLIFSGIGYHLYHPEAGTQASDHITPAFVKPATSKMKVSGFTIIRNSVKYDYPIVEAITSILPLCDEVVVAVGDSVDNTMDLIRSINSPKIKIIETVWDETLRKGGRTFALETDKAFNAISPDSDWAFYIQADETVHEKYYPVIWAEMEKYKDSPEVDGLLFKYKHFYGSYDYVGESWRWYRREIRVVRNNKNIFSYRDAQGFRKKPNDKLMVKLIDAYIYHYGWVKDPRAMQNKQQDWNKFYHDDTWIEQHVAKAEEFDYSNIDSLELFKETHPSAMLDRIRRKNWKFDYDITKRKYSLKEKFKRAIYFFTGYRFGEYKNYKIIK